MKVLVIWELIPEETQFYAVTGGAAELALLCHNKYIGAEENNAIFVLNKLLPSYPQLEDSAPLDITTFSHAVICGQIL